MKSILLIDDDRFVTSLYQGRLQSEGFSVDTANSGKEALDKLSQNCPDVIVLDLNMPGITGAALLKSIRDIPQWQHIPVIVFSSGYIKSLVEEAKQLGVHKFLAKAQCPPKMLITEIKTLLSRPAATASFPVAAAMPEDPTIDDLPALIHLFSTSEDSGLLHTALLKIYQAIYPCLQTAMAMDEHTAQGKLGRMLEELFGALHANPEHITASTKQTLIAGLQKLDGLKEVTAKPELDPELALRDFLRSLEE